VLAFAAVGESMSELINNAFLRLTRRAESQDPGRLVETFVDAAPLLTMLSTRDHQVIYGRRGTGKTHALFYLQELQKRNGDVAVYVDMRTIGSSGLYADSGAPISERGTRLLADTLSAVHDALLTYALENSATVNLAGLTPPLDLFAEGIAEIAVVGDVERERVTTEQNQSDRSISYGVRIGSPEVTAGLAAGATHSTATAHQIRSLESGAARHRVHFGRVGQALQEILAVLAPRRLWILMDEWSVVPMELQPLLADLIRRSMLPHRGVTVKIGAIEQRTRFQIAGHSGDYIGIEVGADVTADLNLDDFMVFDNDSRRATSFFQEMIFKHYNSVDDVDLSIGPHTSSDLVGEAFTQRNAFEEFVRASEGVPRDAINILVLASQRALRDAISMHHVRDAAKTWYQRDKEATVTANANARALLHWIIDEVIGHRRARAFLLRSDARHPLIDALFDARVIHLLKKNVSAHDQPGIRYDVYKLDFGCYVDLQTTARAPEGLLPSDEEGQFADVPPDDYRAIRRAILDLHDFEERENPTYSRQP
jgi:hypothetical protein